MVGRTVVPFIREIESSFLKVGVDGAANLLAVGVRRRAHMDSGHVIGLVEVVEHDFPITRQPHGLCHSALPGVDFALLPVVPYRAKVLF